MVGFDAQERSFPMRILIAEDEAVSRRLLESILVKWGHDVVVCTDGLAAWEALERDDAPRLAILDWMLPEISGVEICRRVRALEHGDQFYLLLVTARQQTEDLVEGLHAGANDYVTKPFDSAELEARIGVGVRMMDLQVRLIESERLRTLMATAGAAAHEINQPLTVLMGVVELWLDRVDDSHEDHIRLRRLLEATERIRDIVKKMTSAAQYVTKPYVGDSVIVDFEASAQKTEGSNR